MATIRELRQRIKSVKNIAKVTRAMQMVAASRMRRAQEQALASRDYAAKAWEIFAHLSAQSGNVEQLHPLLTQREVVNKVAIIMITSDRGLAGAYNSNLIRVVMRYMRENNREEADLIAVGRKGRDFMARYGRNIVAEFTELPDRPSSLDISPISRLALDGFLSGEYDEVQLAYTEFVNTLNQVPTIFPLLPIQPEIIKERLESEELGRALKKMATTEYIYEPSPGILLDTLMPRFVELQVYQAILESLASEHSARMVAMRNATDNAKDLVDDLTLSYNKARQAAITNEMLDIAGGAEALAKQ